MLKAFGFICDQYFISKCKSQDHSLFFPLFIYLFLNRTKRRYIVTKNSSEPIKPKLRNAQQEAAQCKQIYTNPCIFLHLFLFIYLSGLKYCS